MKEKIVIIGTGNMGGALASGLTSSNLVPSNNIFLYDTDLEKAKIKAEELSSNYCDSLKCAVKSGDIIIICVKPNIACKIAEEITEYLNPGSIVCSIAVGIPIKEYRKYIPKEYDFFRIMPNTPALVGEGMSIICYEPQTSVISIEKVLKIFSSVGKTEVLDEKLMNQVTALTGSSPAYIFMMIEAMGNAGIKLGIPSVISYRLAAQAVMGSEKMVLDSRLHPAVLKDQVCSPAGTTIEAVEVLEKTGFRNCVMQAMSVCAERAEEISININKADSK